MLLPLLLLPQRKVADSSGEELITGSVTTHLFVDARSVCVSAQLSARASAQERAGSNGATCAPAASAQRVANSIPFCDTRARRIRSGVACSARL